MPKFRMIHVDHYMCKPVVPFDDLKSDINNRSTVKVPVLRIFGADTDGRKICLHVHGFYPYIAIKNRDSQDETLPSQIIRDIERAICVLVEENRQRASTHLKNANNSGPPQRDTPGNDQPSAEVLDLAEDINLATRLNRERPQLFHLSPEQKIPIHRIEAIKAYDYYGYHNELEDFFKLHIYNPRMVKQLAQLFEDCKVLGRFIPVYWAHLPYVLLFFIDNNLRGMQFIEVDQPYWRKDRAPISSNNDVFSIAQRGETDDIPEAQENFITEIEPTSSCELEADIRFEWILNRQKFGSNGNDDALRELWLDDQQATQATSLIESKPPLFSLERDYLEQLCEHYGVDHERLDLKLTNRPRLVQEVYNSTSYCDSDDSLCDLLMDRDDKAISFSYNNTNRASDECLVNKQYDDLPIEDDEFSDDDEFIKDLPRIVNSIKVGNSSDGTKQDDCFSIESNSETNCSKEVKKNIEPDVKSENNSEMRTNVKLEQQVSNIQNSTQEDDEFSDDDQFLIEAALLAESQNPGLKSQPQVAPKDRRRFSDNSIIDGRSIICSSANQSKTGSQKSTNSSKESLSHEYQYLCIMSMEIHTTTRNKLNPDPMFDPIEAIFYCVRNDTPDTSLKLSQIVGMIITDPFRDDGTPTGREAYIKSPSSRANMSMAQKMRGLLQKTGLSLREINLHMVDTEFELIMTLVEVVKDHDPEILIGYEMEKLSWGYILERASVLNINIGSSLSRVSEPNISHNSKLVEANFVQPIMFTGRMVFSTWRIIRHEITLNTCSYERIHHHALNERVPCFSFATLTNWFNQHRNRWRVIDYYLIRVSGQMRILDRFDLIAKVSELARVYGTQFIDVITRGSQIGIESMMLRLAKLQNLSPLSPTVMQRNKMKAPEALPLVMEPETNIYYDPVAVLDFQSLYPSIVIAYNYCYSTCLGRVMDLETKDRHTFGCSQLHVAEDEIKRLLESNSVHVSPCGVAYVKKSVRHGILPKMLSELIVTRAMVKDQMKKNMKSKRPNMRLQRILDHRQHGLKMMANTTYGYTGASYTGRMPCVEIADSIVSKGRETLENAIELVESHEEWGAKVIYGDTDSIFIQFKGCNRDTAFKRSFEMVDAITQSNPHPIKMKFEKIYQPCVLQTKKRYCGFKYENPEQTRPEFEAKGIETVRRDCCPAAAKMLEMALRIQFTTRDVNQVKRYVQHQFIKIMSGKLSNIQDFIFARQYKPRDLNKSESVFVPAWQIAKRFLAIDPRSEPRLNERVSFVIVYGEPRTPLVNLAKTPIEVLENLSYRVNADYYIQKIICPTLNRIFCTMKVDTLLWYKSMPHQNIIHRSHYLVAQKDQRQGAKRLQQSTMSQYFKPSHCPVCAKSIPITDDICDDCRKNLQASVIRLTEEVARNQRKLFAHHQICRACSSLERSCDMEGTASVAHCVEWDEHYNPCISYDCQNLFRYHQARLDAMNSNYLSQVLKSLN